MRLGIIQGRLSPPIEGFQECPENWMREFNILPELGLNHVDWIITSESFDDNPIFKEDVSNLPINSICADNLVDSRIFDKTFLKDNLVPIYNAAKKNNIQSITIPLLEGSDINDKQKRNIFCSNIMDVTEKWNDIFFSFEAECPAPTLREVVDLKDNFFVTYDTGNITSCGLDHIEYISRLIDKIDNVHLKDRTYDSQTVYPLQGDTEFYKIFKVLKETCYSGVYTLQTARGASGKEKETIMNHKNIFKEIHEQII